MKKILVFLALLLANSSIFAQVEGAQIGAEFHDIVGNPQGGVQTFSSGKVIGSQFFYPTWTPGSVTTIHNEVISKNCTFLFDKVRQQLFVKWKDSATMEADKGQISAFTLNTDRVHNFVSGGKYDPSKKEDFFEVLVKDDKGYTLLRLITSKFVKADLTDIMKVRDGDVSDEFDDDTTYYISYKNGIPKKVLFKERSLEKALPKQKNKITAYFNQNSSTNAIDATFLTGLVQSLNQ